MLHEVALDTSKQGLETPEALWELREKAVCSWEDHLHLRRLYFSLCFLPR
jgi:hypothetical protein